MVYKFIPSRKHTSRKELIIPLNGVPFGTIETATVYLKDFNKMPLISFVSFLLVRKWAIFLFCQNIVGDKFNAMDLSLVDSEVRYKTEIKQQCKKNSRFKAENDKP